MNIEAKNITGTIRVIDNKCNETMKIYHKSLVDGELINGGKLINEFKLYSSALVDYCRIKYNDEVADFLQKYINGRVDYLKETLKAMKKDYAIEKAREKLKAVLAKEPETADVLVKSASGDELIDLMNAWVDARDSFMLTDGSTCINIFYKKLRSLCDKYNCTLSG